MLSNLRMTKRVLRCNVTNPESSNRTHCTLRRKTIPSSLIFLHREWREDGRNCADIYVHPAHRKYEDDHHLYGHVYSDMDRVLYKNLIENSDLMEFTIKDWVLCAYEHYDLPHLTNLFGSILQYILSQPENLPPLMSLDERLDELLKERLCSGPKAPLNTEVLLKSLL